LALPPLGTPKSGRLIHESSVTPFEGNVIGGDTML
jgi:hypothetical protein